MVERRENNFINLPTCRVCSWPLPSQTSCPRTSLRGWWAAAAAAAWWEEAAAAAAEGEGEAREEDGEEEEGEEEAAGDETLGDDAAIEVTVGGGGVEDLLPGKSFFSALDADLVDEEGG